MGAFCVTVIASAPMRGRGRGEPAGLDQSSLRPANPFAAISSASFGNSSHRIVPLASEANMPVTHKIEKMMNAVLALCNSSG